MPRQKFDDSRVLKPFGDKLQKTRVSRGLTQAQLAELTDLALNTIQAYEQGLRAPGLPVVSRLAWALDMKPTKLLAFLDGVEA